MHWESRRCVFKKSIPWWNQVSMKRHYCYEGVNESQTASIEEKRKLPSSWLILLRIIRHLTGKDYNPSIGCRLPTSGKSAASCHPAFAGNAVCQWAAFEIMLKCLTHSHVQDCISQKTWSGLSPTRNPVHLRLWGLSLFCTRNCAKLGLWSDPKSKFYRTLVKPKVRVLWDRKSGSRPTGVSNMPSGFLYCKTGNFHKTEMFRISIGISAAGNFANYPIHMQEIVVKGRG